jgi:hypothetical protein
MTSSSPVPAHELHTQSLIGEMTTSSLAVPATIPKSYNPPTGSLNPPALDRSAVNDIISTVTLDTDSTAQPSLWREVKQPTPEAPDGLLLDAIAAGELDQHLVAIADAVHARRVLLHTVKAATAIAELCIGDQVRINRSVRPGYLHGEHGVIIDLDDHAATVRLIRPLGKFRSGEVRCPPLALDKLNRPTHQTAA